MFRWAQNKYLKNNKQMKKTLLTFYGLAFVAGLSAQEVERTTDGAKNFIRTQNVTEEVRFYSDDIVRVIKYPARQMPDKKSYPVIMTPEQVDITYTDQGKAACWYRKRNSARTSSPAKTARTTATASASASCWNPTKRCTDSDNSRPENSTSATSN